MLLLEFAQKAEAARVLGDLGIFLRLCECVLNHLLLNCFLQFEVYEDEKFIAFN